MLLLIKFSLFLLFLAMPLWAGVPSYEKLKSSPKGLAKDYYIYRFAKESKASKAELKKLRTQIYRYQGSIKTLFDNKLGAIQKSINNCSKYNLSNIDKADEMCQNMLLSINFVKSLNPTQRADLFERLKMANSKFLNFVQGFSKDDPLAYYIKIGDTTGYFKYYFNAKDKDEFLNRYKLSQKLIANSINHWQFKSIVQESIIGKKNEKFRRVLLEANPNSLSGDMAFLFGLNAILLYEDEKAVKFFEVAAKRSKFASNKDNANFWIYLITKDKELLKSIANSADINIYSLFAREFSSDEKIKIAVPKPSTKELLKYDYTDPFTWQRTREKVANMPSSELISYASRFYTQSTLGEYSYIMERAHNHKIHFYPMPFMEYIGTDDVKRQALILALARQESRFVPSAISTSYALGMMQFMPFLAIDIAAKLGMSGFDIDDMFKPQIAYKFANFHLDYLEKYLYNPLFIAYAYNGGIGFTKRMLLRGDLFNRKGEYSKYEPFLSMDLVPYAESRIYGKKVLANYIIYLAALGKSTKISHFFDATLIPELSDGFRDKLSF
ncbi:MULTISPECIES: lytic transglycosylase domain-containing protein [Campylobacter]|uniref:lytic transglycosylase domain-containing protein n=1 Tax=Campylobacter TaxID=194 RepID=UPI0015D805F3|nr:MULTISPECIES: lytic transglycosylase domain-containing protein [unclassified Campylobacter]MCR8678265.1 lytic transglycosylase domain-containing protein [Campylobacter sp. RM19072]